LKNVLVATDGSKAAVLAVRAAVDISGKTGAELHVVHVWQGLPSRTYPAASRDYCLAYEWEAEREARGLLEQQIDWIRTSGGIVARAHLRRGRPAEETAGLSKNLGVDLVVVGSRGAGTVKRLVTGSVSERIIQPAPCPTWSCAAAKGRGRRAALHINYKRLQEMAVCSETDYHL